jgi:hypothetical protein
MYNSDSNLIDSVKVAEEPPPGPIQPNTCSGMKAPCLSAPYRLLTYHSPQTSQPGFNVSANCQPEHPGADHQHIDLIINSDPAYFPDSNGVTTFVTDLTTNQKFRVSFQNNYNNQSFSGFGLHEIIYDAFNHPSEWRWLKLEMAKNYAVQLYSGDLRSSEPTNPPLKEQRFRLDTCGPISPSPTIPPPPVTPTPTSTVKGYRVFVTSSTYSGNLGGLSGADAKCQERANAAALGGVWKAWLSVATANGDAASRLYHSSFPYKLLDGSIIANDWVDLTDQMLFHPINVTETREFISEVPNYWNVWTNTWTSGTIYDTQPSLTCNNWASDSSTMTGRGGSTAEINYRWTASEYSGHFCNTPSRLYCFEQPSLPTPTLIPCVGEGKSIPVVPYEMRCCPGLVLCPPPPETLGSRGTCLRKCPTITPTPLRPIKWETQSVRLSADDFYILVNGKTFTATNTSVKLHSDGPTPNNPNYTTLEAEWREKNGVEMRLYAYFYKNEKYWWVYEMRTYNGEPKGEWIYYKAGLPLNPLGIPYKLQGKHCFSGSNGLLPGDVKKKTDGSICFTNLTLWAFIRPTPTMTKTPTPTPKVLTPMPTWIQKPTVTPTPTSALVRRSCQSCDFNQDGKVNSNDVGFLSQCYGASKPNWKLIEGLSCQGADLNQDGKIDIADSNLFRFGDKDGCWQYYNQDCPVIKPTSTPTPTKTLNRPPVISTYYLRPARLWENYKEVITGYDEDGIDQLQMQITGLPPGIYKRQCIASTSSAYGSRNEIRCEVSGRPYFLGNYKVTTTLTDQKGGIAKKQLNLGVSLPF